ncbi:AraC family transcriptional regulator [Paenibacillus sp. IB182496]|uniref:AraC family transcriptional regulator n=1 Tax=Paenibacillus sabuli TaxID=2772509 RepID=A0A927GQL2_9BACL|nr:helix-turn-helix domain-containing protein [Paenibacillus sabuli]MBD2844396.1 AraC family transcriptional regulator [Paenibacillus sabuli]
MNKSRTPTFAKFLVSYMVVLLLPFLVVWFFLYAHFERVQTEQVYGSALNDLNQMKNIIESNINETYNMAARIAAEEELSPHYLQEFYHVYRSQKLLNYTTDNEFFYNVTYYVRNTDYMYSARTTYTLPIYYQLHAYKNWSYSEFASDINELKHPVLRPSEEAVIDGRNENVVTYLVPIPNNSASPYGTAVFTIREQSVRELFAPMVGEEGGDVVILDAGGRVVMSMADTSYVAEGVPEQLLPESGKQLVQPWQDGDRRLIVASNHSGETGWTFIRFVSAEQLMSPISKLRERSTVIFVLILVLGSAIVYSMMYMNYNPVKALKLQFQDVKGRLDKQRELNLPALQQYFARGLLKGKFDSRAMFNASAVEAGMTLRSASYYVIVLQWDPGGVNEAFLSSDYAKQWLAVLTEQEEGYYVEIFEHYKLALIVSEPAEACTRAGWESRHLTVFNRTNVQVAIGLGNPYRELSDIGKSYFEASTALQHRWIKGNHSVIMYREIDRDQPAITWYPQQELELLTASIKQGSTKAILSSVEACLDNIKRNSSSLFMARSLCYEVVNTLLKTVIAVQPNRLQSVVLPGVLSLTDLETFDKLEQTVMDISEEVCAQLSAAIEDTPSQDADKLLQAIYEYIGQRYCSYDFSVQRMAEHLSLSSKYVSSYFKERSGQTVSEYVNEMRLAKAKELLRTTNKRIQDVVMAVGFSDSSSFIRKFKQEVRLTPGEYRRLHAR